MTTKWTNRGLLTLLALTTGALGAPQLQAQSTGGDEAESERLARAETLRVEARTTTEAGDFRRASFLYREAASTAGDHPRAVSDLVEAATLAYYAGRNGQAVKDFQAAGEAALQWGDVLTAARSFLDGAWVAAASGDRERAVELARRAEKLSSSPLIQRQERIALLSRIGEPVGGDPR